MAKNNKPAALNLTGAIYGPAKGMVQVFASLGVSPLPNTILLSACSHPNPKKAETAYLTDVLLAAHNLVAMREAANGWSETEDQAIDDGYTHVVFFTKGEIGEQVTAIDDGITNIVGIAQDDTILAGGLLISTADAEGTSYGDYVISPSAAVLYLEGAPTIEGVEVSMAAAEPEPEPEPAPAAKGGKGGKGGKGAKAPEAEPEPEAAPAGKGGKGGKGAPAGKGAARTAGAEDTGW